MNNARVPLRGAINPFPNFQMVYTIRLNYGFKVEAKSQQDALRQAKQMIGKTPDMAIGSVEYGTGKKRGLFSMLIFGA